MKSKSPFTCSTNKRKSWEHKPGDVYIATGVDISGRRFRIKSNNWTYLNGVNIWRGSKWLLRDGKRWLIQRVYN